MNKVYISIFLLLLMHSVSIFGKHIGIYGNYSEILNDSLKQGDVLLKFEPNSSVLKRRFLDNTASLVKLDFIVTSNLEKLKSGKSHLAITGFIMSEMTDSAKAINQISVQSSVVKSYLMLKYNFTNSCITYRIDNSQEVLNNLIEISYVESPVATDDNRFIYYTLKPTPSNLKIVLSNYGKIPYEKSFVIPNVVNVSDGIVIEKAKERTQYDLPLIKRIELDSSIDLFTVDSLPNFFIYSYSLRGIAIKNGTGSTICASFAAKQKKQLVPKTRSIFYPVIGIKTNLISWAGYTPSLELGKQTSISNIELEGYFAQRFSISIDGIYTPLFRNSEDLQWWKVNGIAMEARVWLGAKDVFKGFYSGFYVITGEFDIMKESIGMFGYTGKYYGGGLSFGFVQPIFKALHLEIGVRGGFRDDIWDSYEIEEGKSYYLSSGSRRGFKLQGLRFCLMLRFGKQLKIL